MRKETGFYNKYLFNNLLKVSFKLQLPVQTRKIRKYLSIRRVWGQFKDTGLKTQDVNDNEIRKVQGERQEGIFFITFSRRIEKQTTNKCF